MRAIFLYLIISFIFLTSHQKENGFLITGHITGIADSTQVMLRNISSGEVLDSTFVMNSRFTFRGKLDDVPEELRIISGRNELLKGNLFYTDLLIGNENVRIKGDISDMPLNVTTTGSSIQKKAAHYNRQLHAWNVKLGSLRADLKLFPDSVSSIEKTQATEKVKVVQDSLENWKTSFIKDNFNSHIALLLYNYRRDFQVDTLRRLYNSLSEDLQQSKFGKSVHTQINFPKPIPGDSYHNFEAATPDGRPFKLSEIKDKYILLQFAGSGCYWSNLSMSEIRDIYKQYKDSVSLISYFIDNQSEWLHTVRMDSIEWLSIWSKETKYSDACNKYSVTGTPTFFLISPDKKVITTWFGYEEGIIKKAVKQALSK